MKNKKLFMIAPLFALSLTSCGKTYEAKDYILDENSEIIINKLENSALNYENISSTLLNSLHDYGEINIDGEAEKITLTNLRSHNILG